MSNGHGRWNRGALPPPPHPENGYFLAGAAEQEGPFSLDELRERIRSGELERETLAWTRGMNAWAPAGSVRALQPLFGAEP